MLTVLAAGFAVPGFLSPTMIPLCFEPEAGAEIVVVCPTKQSVAGRVSPESAPSIVDIDNVVSSTATPLDLFAVEAVGLAAAAIASAAAIRGIRGSSERCGLPVALAVLKLPTGALTALLGLLLMRGQFLPGLSALDSSAQILAWALVFGYAQQLFTRMIDQQAHTVLDEVRSPERANDSLVTPAGSTSRFFVEETALPPEVGPDQESTPTELTFRLMSCLRPDYRSVTETGGAMGDRPARATVVCERAPSSGATRRPPNHAHGTLSGGPAVGRDVQVDNDWLRSERAKPRGQLLLD